MLNTDRDIGVENRKRPTRRCTRTAIPLRFIAAGERRVMLQNKMDDIELIRKVIPLWYAQKSWAEELLKRSFGLEKVEDILSSEYRGFNEIPGSNWTYRTHGVGVDISRSPDVGGIDFDFDKKDPDEWRLTIFFERQYNEGNIPQMEFRHLFEEKDRLNAAIKGALGNAT